MSSLYREKPQKSSSDITEPFREPRLSKQAVPCVVVLLELDHTDSL